MTSKNEKKVYKPVLFFCIAFAFTWVFWSFAEIFRPNPPIKIFFLLLGLIGPFVTALALIFASPIRKLKEIFFNKLLNLKLITLKSIPAIIFIPPITVILSILISLLFGFSSDQLKIAHTFSFTVGAMPSLLLLFLAASFEELGWRGYAIESLNVKHNYFVATTIFAVLWALWHFPLFFMKETYQYNILQLHPLYAVNFMVGIIPLAFIISWVCRMNSGSILTAILFHFGINISQEAFNVHPITKCIQTFVLVGFAYVIVKLNKKMFFESGR